MEENVTHSRLELLRRQRAHRRGAITPLSKKLTTFMGEPLGAVSDFSMNNLEINLRSDIGKHESLQDDIDSLLDQEAIEANEAERSRHDEIHASVIMDLDTLKHSHVIFTECLCLRPRILELLDLGKELSSTHTSEFKDLANSWDAIRMPSGRKSYVYLSSSSYYSYVTYPYDHFFRTIRHAHDGSIDSGYSQVHGRSTSMGVLRASSAITAHSQS